MVLTALLIVSDNEHLLHSGKFTHAQVSFILIMMDNEDSCTCKISF